MPRSSNSFRYGRIGLGFFVQKTIAFTFLKEIYIGFLLKGLYQTQYPFAKRLKNHLA